MNVHLHNAPIIVRGALYVLLGVILILHAFKIVTGGIIQYMLVLMAGYFVVHGAIISGFYERILQLFK